MGPRVLFASLVASVVCYAEAARAGCPSTCDVALSPVVVEPELACLGVDPVESGCNCGVRLSIFNDCQTPLDVQDIQFSECGIQYQPLRASCETIGPGEFATSEFGVTEDGRKRWAFTVTSQGVDHRVTVDAKISNYDGDPGCGCPVMVGAGERRNHPGAFALATFPLLFVVRRTRKRASPTKR